MTTVTLDNKVLANFGKPTFQHFQRLAEERGFTLSKRLLSSYKSRSFTVADHSGRQLAERVTLAQAAQIILNHH